MPWEDFWDRQEKKVEGNFQPEILFVVIAETFLRRRDFSVRVRKGSKFEKYILLINNYL